MKKENKEDPGPKEIDIKDQVIQEIKPKIQESFSNLKKDLLADIKEEIAKMHKPQTEQTDKIPSAIEGMLGKLQGSDLGGIDLKSIMSNIQPPAIPHSELTKAEYLQQQKDQRNHQMLMTILQLVLSPQSNAMGSGSGAFQELMMRNMIDSVMDGTIQRKVMTQAIIKKLGQDIPADLGIMQGAKDALQKKASGQNE